ncbi:MAG TPA: transglycosylase SLT domain-containing protein [Candidatus Acidoferrum sp.]|nr:transglycosylase SLT domain-containing protein [Candidatus Acidoferrum sp.]
MSQHSRLFAGLILGAAIVVTALAVTRQVITVTGDAEAVRLSRDILTFVAVKNPQASIKAFQGFPETLVAEAQRTKIDHCLALAVAEVESEFRHDVIGSAGAIGLFQVMPSTAALFESSVGPFRRPNLTTNKRDLGDLAEPSVSTRFAMAYLRDILSRKPTVREALTEYNGGPAGRHPHYYRMVMGAYVEILERADLRCRYREVPKVPAPLLAGMIRM